MAQAKQKPVKPAVKKSVTVAKHPLKLAKKASKPIKKLQHATKVPAAKKQKAKTEPKLSIKQQLISRFPTFTAFRYKLSHSTQPKKRGRKKKVAPQKHFSLPIISWQTLGNYSEFLLIIVIAATFLFIRSPLGAQASMLPGKLPIKIEQTQNWCVACRASAISIPSVKFEDSNILQMAFDEEQKTWPTPVSGIATPKETVTNNVIIFGHSKWFNKINEFAKISQLKIGDEIKITDQFGKEHTFIVEKLQLVDRQNGESVHKKEDLTVTLLTSARYNGEWLLPGKLDDATQDTTKDSQDYAIFVVTAKPKST